ncbi:MAG: cytidine/deoxycytidylate deaminase family protein [Candidatus Nanoarchaeia archaeon]|nr:cytidine/deoxycytidylate deaminase family protein [Candidatus Nanoarchaeia archaeon]MDD5587645.1 cytidine/deoxycytidylate deaminase family protein [Candidatus Nanoarchaeia archaeon]
MNKRFRPSWDELFMFQVYVGATRSSCVHLQTGALIVKDKRVIASGYNGAPPGIGNCLDVGCRKDKYKIDFNDKGKGVCRGSHAEINAMSQIARKDLEGTTLYSLYFPCSACAKAIAGNKIGEVVHSKTYQEHDSLTTELFREAGVKLRQLEIDIEKYFKILRIISKK